VDAKPFEKGRDTPLSVYLWDGFSKNRRVGHDTSVLYDKNARVAYNHQAEYEEKDEQKKGLN
jgi:hypothetical protein